MRAPQGDRAHACQPLDGKDCVKQCNAGDLTSCASAAFLYNLGADADLGQDFKKSGALLEKGCNDPRPDTLGVKAGMCSSLGDLYLRGDGYAKDLPKAAQLKKRACKMGAAESCTTIGYGIGFGVWGYAADPVEGASLLQRGCNGGEAQSCVHLGRLYRKGAGSLAADKARAASLFRQACDGSYAGCTELGEMFEKGESGPPDAAKARRLYDRACKLGEDNGCRHAKALP